MLSPNICHILHIDRIIPVETNYMKPFFVYCDKDVND